MDEAESDFTYDGESDVDDVAKGKKRKLLRRRERDAREYREKCRREGWPMPPVDRPKQCRQMGKFMTYTETKGRGGGEGGGDQCH